MKATSPNEPRKFYRYLPLSSLRLASPLVKWCLHGLDSGGSGL